MPSMADCAVEKAYRGMSDEDKRAFEDAITSFQLSAGKLAAAFRELGFQIDRAAVGHYRRKLQAGKAELESS